MKALKYIWLFFVVGLLAACTAEDLESSASGGSVDGEAATQIVISRNDLLPVNMNGRAAGGIDGLLSKVNDLNILLPSIKEQRAIASYFTSLDRQINLQSQRLEKLKQIKATCLDNMFV